MATTNKRVQGYVPGWISDALANYQKERGLNQSQAVEEILGAFFRDSMPKPEAGDSDQKEEINRLNKWVQSLEKQFFALLHRMDVIDEEIVGQKDVNEMIWRDIQELYPPVTLETQPMTAAEKEEAIEAVISQVNNSGSESELPLLKYLSVYLDPVEAVEPAPEPVQPEPKPEAETEAEAEPDPDVRRLSHKGLARRLGITPATLTKHFKSGNFENWVRNKDIQGIRWQYDPVARVYLGKLSS